MNQGCSLDEDRMVHILDVHLKLDLLRYNESSNLHLMVLIKVLNCSCGFILHIVVAGVIADHFLEPWFRLDECGNSRYPDPSSNLLVSPIRFCLSSLIAGQKLS